jgi:hypothetical protein
MSKYKPQNKCPQLVSTVNTDSSFRQIGHVSCRGRPTRDDEEVGLLVVSPCS